MLGKNSGVSFVILCALVAFYQLQVARADDDVFLKQTSDRTSVFVGEQLVNTFELYTRVPLINPQFMDLAYEGFWQESFSEDQRGSAEIRGRFYNVIKIRRALFALSPGEKTLPQREIKAATILMRQPPLLDDFDPFDRQFMQRFFGQEEYRERVFRSNALKVSVKQLPSPSSDLPAWPGSTGLVGSTSVRVSSSAAPIRSGETKLITVEVSSLGDLSKLQSPPIADNSAYRVYDERPRSRNEESNGRLVSRRTFRISVVPLTSGEIRLAPLRLAYFDPASQDYHIIESAITPFSALPNPAVASLAPSAPAEIGATVTPTEILAATPLSQSSVANASDEPLPGLISIAALALFSLSALIIVALFWLIKRRTRADSLDRLSTARITQSDDFQQLYQAFSTALIAKLALNPPPDTPDALRFAISKLNLEAQVSHQLLSMIDGLSLVLTQLPKPSGAVLARLKEESQLALSALSRSRA